MKSQIDFFNSIAGTWDESCNHDMVKIDYILDLIDIKSGDCILDVGTGTGILIPSLYERVTHLGSIKGIDVAKKMIEVAQQKYKYDNVVFKCEDALNTDDKSKYDHIICYSMFPHFQCRKSEVVSILAQKLKIGGKLTICHSQSREGINNLHKRADEIVKEDNLPTMAVMREYFLDAHLKVLEEIDNKDMFVIIGCR